MRRVFFVFLFFSCLPKLLLAYSLEQYSQDLSSLTEEEKELFFSTANRLKCPTCTGLSVLGTESSFSMQIRKKVLDLVREEKSGKQIASYFENQYGPWLFRTPPKEGVHIGIWLFPFLVISSLLFLAVYYLCRRREKEKDEDAYLEELFRRDLALYKVKKV